MFFSSLLGVAVLATYTVAAPTVPKATRSIHKRSSPVIANGFTAQQTTQITDGIRDALELASYVVSVDGSYVDPILEKYFNSGDNQLVKDVMNTILGGDPNSDAGNDLLGSITIVSHFPGLEI